MKPRANIYLEDHVAAQLELLAKRPGFNKSRVVNEALEKFLNPERDEASINALGRRLDRLNRHLERLDRNQRITLETLALFIRYFLTITPPLGEAERPAAHALGQERFEAFAEQVGRRIAKDKNLIEETLTSGSVPTAKITDFTERPGPNSEAPNSEEADLPPLLPVDIEAFEEGEEDALGEDLFEEDFMELDEFEGDPR